MKTSLKRVLILLAVPAALLAGLGVLLRQPNWGSLGPAAKADAARLERDVRVFSVDLVPRDVEHVANLDKAAAYIARELKAAGGRVSEQEFAFEEFTQRNKKVKRGPFRNVIAVFGPETGERIVVGAHYDAFGPFPAADDNASGSAALLELARMLGKDTPALRTELVAYTTEEPPYFATKHMGSARHALLLKEQGAKVRAMLSLETMGTFKDGPGTQGYPNVLMGLFYPSAGDFISVVGNLSSAPLARRVKKAMRSGGVRAYSVSAPAFIPGIDYSDHASYWEQGYPAVMVTDTAFYRNQHYHTTADTADRLDYRRMAQVTAGAFAAVHGLAR